MQKRKGIPSKVKNRVEERDKHKCVSCGASPCEFHHIDGNPSNYSPENIVLLCPSCHDNIAHGRVERDTRARLTRYAKSGDPKDIFGDVLKLTILRAVISREAEVIFDRNDEQHSLPSEPASPPINCVTLEVDISNITSNLTSIREISTTFSESKLGNKIQGILSQIKEEVRLPLDLRSGQTKRFKLEFQYQDYDFKGKSGKHTLRVKHTTGEISVEFKDEFAEDSPWDTKFITRSFPDDGPLL